MKLTLTLHCDTIQGRTDCVTSLAVPVVPGQPTLAIDVAARAAGWDVRPVGTPGGGEELKAWCPDCKEVLFGMAVKAMSEQCQDIEVTG